MNEKIKALIVYLNLWRILPVYLFFKTNRFKDKCRMDLEQWVKYSSKAVAKRKKWFQFGYCLINEKSCRNILLKRLSRNLIMYAMTRILFAPLESCYITTSSENIGGGLSFQHGFATIVAAKEIGVNCRVYQQVTIGYNGDKCPIIGDNAKICAGAIVIGGVKVGDNVCVGAGAVVTHDVSSSTVVAGVPARVIKQL